MKDMGNQPDQGNPSPKRESAQVTLSTIGDISVAAAEAAGNIRQASVRGRIAAMLAFGSLAYGLTAAVMYQVVRNGGNARWWLHALLPAFVASLAYLWGQRWKARAREERRKLKAWQNTLEAVSYEAANSANAVRAQLLGFRSANPQVNMPDHLREIETATQRIDAVVLRARDPLSWKSSA